MRRTFTLGSVTDRKVVVIETNGPRLDVMRMKPDGSTKRSETELKDEAAARAECDRLVRELLARGFVERTESRPTKGKPAKPAGVTSKSADPAIKPANVDFNSLYEDDEPPPSADEPVLPRLRAESGSGPSETDAPKKKKRKKGGKKKAETGEALDKRVVAAFLVVGAVCVAFVGYIAYDIFLKPASIVGSWAGSKLDFETGKPMSMSQYGLVLDKQRRATMTLQDKFTSVGTYTLRGNRLTLTLHGEKDEEGEEGPTIEQQYRVSVGRVTLDLFDPASGKKVVQLIRQREEPAIANAPPPPEAPSDLTVGAVDKGDAAADDRLAAIEFSPKDGAFKLRYPQGWKPETGSRPDNLYSWARFTRGSAKIQVFADTKGSLMSGSDSAREHEEGSESAPVHVAHELYARNAAEEYTNYKESKPTLFKGSPLGEGRIALFTASSGGLLGGTKLRGYRVTLLTNDRRVSVLCDCPAGDFAKLKPTFLAVCRSLAR